MRDADIIFGWVRNGVAHISDRHGIGRTIPPADNQQDVNLLAGSECDGWTLLKFTRPLKTCDTNDRPIAKNTMKVIFAYGANDPTSDALTFQHYHGPNKGSKSLILLDGPLYNTPVIPGEEHIHFDIFNNMSEIPVEKTYYNCKFIKFPTLPTKHHIIRFEPKIQQENLAFVHHMILHLCPTSADKDPRLVGQNRRCYSSTTPVDFKNCNQIVAAWAVGGGPEVFPPHVGLPLGGVDGVVYGVLEMHY
uniref:DOMON domain-containing protein n=1 Tax=Ciona savignyi TaxID=51511 RepID=H2ZCA1_CIOSA